MPVVDNVNPGASSAQSAMSYSEFLANDPRYNELVAGDNIFANLTNPFTGYQSRAKADYDMYLQNLNKENEQRALANARAYDLWLEDTRYQRAVKDLQKAGLNPWLALNNGFASNPGNSVTSSSAKGSTFEASDKDRKSGLLGLISSILKIL